MHAQENEWGKLTSANTSIAFKAQSKETGLYFTKHITLRARIFPSKLTVFIYVAMVET